MNQNEEELSSMRALERRAWKLFDARLWGLEYAVLDLWQGLLACGGHTVLERGGGEKPA
jgi:hypothetical protein